MTTRAIPSPCIGLCRIGDDGLCEGCLRSLAEIAGWSSLDDARRLRLMTEELPRRAAARALPE